MPFERLCDAFGLAAANGVLRWLDERGIGFETGIARVPIVAGAVLFDLGVGDPGARPTAESGYAACENATDGVIDEGSVGAGTGATVGKLPDPGTGMKGGFGTASERHGELVVGAVAAVNSLGRIVDADGSPIAWNTGDPEAEAEMWAIENTTLVCVGTNARLTRESALRLAYAAHDGIALAVRPAHTHWDGDVAFAFGTGEIEAGLGPAPGDGVERRRRGDPPRRPRGDGRARLSGRGRGRRRDEDARRGRGGRRHVPEVPTRRRRGRRSCSAWAIPTPT